MRTLFLKIGSSILGLWLADALIEGVDFTGNWKILLLAGTVLGIVNFFLKPVLNLITLPLRIVTFGLFGLLINMALIFLVDVYFKELSIAGIEAYFWTAIVIWALNLLMSLFSPKRKHNE